MVKNIQYFIIIKNRRSNQFILFPMYSSSKPKSQAAHTKIVNSYLRSSPVTLQNMVQKVQASTNPDTMLQLENLFIERNPMQESEMERQIWIILELFKAMVEHDLANLSTEPQTTSSHDPMDELDQFLQNFEHADRVCMKVRKTFLIDNSVKTHSSIQQAVSKLLSN